MKASTSNILNHQPQTARHAAKQATRTWHAAMPCDSLSFSGMVCGRLYTVIDDGGGP